MDRDKVIQLLYKFYNAGLSFDEGNEIITVYCLEKGKKDKDIEKLILALMVAPEYRVFCISDALNYYRQKYYILELYKQLPNDLMGSRQIILIY